MSDYHDATVRVLLIHIDGAAAQQLGSSLAARIQADITYIHAGDAVEQLLTQEPLRFDLALIDSRGMSNGQNPLAVGRLVQQHTFLPVVLYAYAPPDDPIDAFDPVAVPFYNLPAATPVAQVADLLRQAVRQRALDWQQCFQEITGSIPRLDDNDAELLHLSHQWLCRLGYSDAAIYRHLLGWSLGKEFAPKLRAAIQGSYLYRQRPVDGSAQALVLDPRDDPAIAALLDSPEPMLARPAGRFQDVLVPLRGNQWVDEGKRGLLGLLVLRQIAPGSFSRQERANLLTLGQHISLGMQSVLARRQLAYQRRSDQQIRDTHREILSLAASDRNTDKILDLFAHAIAKALLFERVAISTIERPTPEMPTGTLYVRGLKVLSAEEEQRVRHNNPVDLAAFTSLHRDQFHHFSSYFIPDGAYEAENYEGYLLTPEPHAGQPWEWHARDLLRTPITSSDGKLLGFISSDVRQNRRRPDINTFHALEDFAIQVAVAIENIQTSRYYRSFETLEQMSLQLSRVHARRELYEVLFKSLPDLMDVETLILGQYHADQGMVEIVFREPVRPEERDLPDRRPELHGLTGYIARTGQALIFRRGAEVKAFFAEHPEIQRLGLPIKSWVGVPLKIDAQVIGVLALQHFESENVYDELHLKMLNTLAGQLAVLLERFKSEEANFEAAYKFGLELASAEVNREFVEAELIRRACELSDADYGLMLHYDADKQRLVLGEVFAMHGAKPVFNLADMPLERPPGQRAGLSTIVARTKQPRYWDDAPSDPDYIEVLKSTKSQLSVPVLVPDERESDGFRLLAVLTLEASHAHAFNQRKQNTLVMLCQFAALALLRAREQEQIAALMGWGMYDLSSKISGHERGSNLRSLDDQVRYVEQEYTRLFEELRQLYDRANHILLEQSALLEQLTPLDIDDVLKRFVSDHAVLYPASTISLYTETNLRAERLVLANEVGVMTMLRILVDYAFDQLQGQPYGDVKITLESQRRGVQLTMVYTGARRPLDAALVRFLTEYEERRQRIGSSLSLLKLLSTLFDAPVTIPQNDEDGVAITLGFPPLRADLSISVGDPLTASVRQQRLSPTHMLWLQRGIAAYTAQLFTATVSLRGRELYDHMAEMARRLANCRELTQLIRQPTSSADLQEAETLRAQQEIDEFLERRRELLRNKKQVTLDFRGPRLAAAVGVHANRLGLRHVLNILVNNAEQAINTRLEALGDAAARCAFGIRLSAEVEAEGDRALVAIRVHNTGSWMDDATARRVFSLSIAKNQDRGRGLLMSRFLLDAYHGTITLDHYGREEGVQFTIRLRCVPVAATAEQAP